MIEDIEEEMIKERAEISIEEELESENGGDEIKEHPFCTKDIKINPVPVTLDNVVKSLNRSLFDLWVTTVYKLTFEKKKKLLLKKDILKKKYKIFLLNKDFDDTITRGSNDRKNIVKKFKMFGEMIEEVLT